jgi:hypothetical protein
VPKNKGGSVGSLVMIAATHYCQIQPNNFLDDGVSLTDGNISVWALRKFVTDDLT